MTVKVLIVDDSAFFRRRLTEIINADPRLQVVATAADGQQAVEQVSIHRPDVITMDLEMPVMDGIAAVRQIMRRRPTPVLMLSTWTTEGAKATLDALEAGAMDFLPKRFEDLTDDRQTLCERIYFLATHARSQAAPLQLQPTSKPARRIKTDTDKALNLVVIGTSTGGPVALQKILTQLPASFPYPLILLQHMPATFTPSFAERLNNQCQIRVKQADNNDTLQAGTAYLAPGGNQLLVKGRPGRLYLQIERGSETETYRPSIDVTLTSVSKICPATTLTIILTGMGADGSEGTKKMHALGGAVWAQDQQSSTIYGMPMAVAKAGVVDKILGLSDIGPKLAAL
ncbi:MAG: chemotaxis response regulator protein-glutamate methylesterase [Methylophaga sp.]|nr:chemotaxis response regulator protein-glutamate methylesterase [Methylophaga sp.]